MDASVVILVGSAAGAGLLCIPLLRLARAEQLVRVAGRPRGLDIHRTVLDLVSLAELRATGDLVSLSTGAAQMRDPLLLRGVTLAMQGRNGEQIRAALESGYLGRQFAQNEGMVSVMRSAFTFGMLLMGLVGCVMILYAAQSGRDLPPLAGALVAGAVFSGLLSSTLSRADWAGDQVSARRGEILRRLVVVEGVVALADGVGPAELRRRLSTLLPGSAGERQEQRRAA